MLREQTTLLVEMLSMPPSQVDEIRSALRRRNVSDEMFPVMIAHDVAFEHIIRHGMQEGGCRLEPCRLELASLCLMELVNFEGVRRHELFSEQRGLWELQDDDRPTAISEIPWRSYALQLEVMFPKEKALERAQSQLLRLGGFTDRESFTFASGLAPGGSKVRARDRRNSPDVRTLRGWSHPEPETVLRPSGAGRKM